VPAQVRTAISAGVHALVALLVGVALAHGINIGPHWSSLLTSALFAVAVGGYMAATHWLATRKGDIGWPVYARGLARLLTLGAGALVPVPEQVPARVQQLRDEAAARQAAAGKHTAAA